MPRTTRLTTASLLFIACTLALAGCGGDGAPEPTGPLAGRLAGYDLLLVTLDTTRADHLGCYGRDVARTPTLDALADGGVRFERALTAVPLTLPSHCSLMTGRYPREHGVRDNGRKALPDTLPTLADVFREHGYDTGAFVASFVLESRFGVDRGFGRYADELGALAPGADLLHQEIPANVVTDRALAWLEQRGDAPFFCWVHYFDAHDPYEPPAGYTGFGDPYDGELAFVDAQLARIVAQLERSGRRDRTLIVVAGDHGESFGEHGRSGHTIFLYHTNLRVPLLFNGPGALPAGRVVEDGVELVEVFPTLLELWGWSAPEGLLGRSLVPAMEGAALGDRPAYSENEFVTNAYGWAQQRSVTLGRWKYISSAEPELYDLEDDPGEQRNLIAEKPELAAELEAALAERFGSMTPGRAEDIELDAEARAAIEKLGYSASGSDAAVDELLTAGLPDPKAMLPALDLHDEAKKARGRGDLAGAIRKHEEALEINANSTLMLYELAVAYLDAGRAADAAQRLERALEIDPTYLPALVSMGEALTALGRREEAVLQYEAALALVPDSPEVHAVLASELKQLGRAGDAIEHFEEALAGKPGWGQVQLDLALLYEETGRPDEALRYYGLAAASSPQNVPLRARHAQRLADAGRSNEADAAFRALYADNPTNEAAIATWVSRLRTSGRDGEARRVLESARTAVPGSVAVVNLLARLLASSPDDAVRDGAAAHALATELCRGEGARSPERLSTLAAAEAALERFEEAVRTIDRALQLARGAQGREALVLRLQAQGADYAAGRATRDPGF